VRDGHPDPLREWTEDGDVTPPGWYAVRAWTRMQFDLFLVREVHGRVAGFWDKGVWQRVERQPEGFPVSLGRTVWWSPSEELACEVARQYRDGERGAVEVQYGAQPGTIHGGGFKAADSIVRSFRPWTAAVFQRMPDGIVRPVRRFTRTTPHTDPEWWEDGYIPPMQVHMTMEEARAATYWQEWYHRNGGWFNGKGVWP
jgi:hypothetical protein